MKRLEDFIKDNRQQFEDHSPSRQHEDKFLNLLKEQERLRNAERFSNINKWLKIAAAIIILVGFGVGIVAIIDVSPNSEQHTSDKLPVEIIEMEQYYAVQTQEKLNHIETLAGTGPEATKVKTMLLREIESLNKSSKSLKSEYMGGTRDERLVDAIKNNYRILGNLLDKVVDQLDKPSDDSSEKINQHLKSQRYETTLS